MGGRGGSSGISNISGLDVTFQGETTRYYFSTRGGTHYYQRGIEGNPEQTPQNMTPSEFRGRVESNGATTKSVSVSERQKDEIRYKKDREENDRMLNTAWYKAAPRPRKVWKGH